MVGLAPRRERKARDFRAKLGEPGTQPAALEAGVSRYQNAPARVHRIELLHSHFFQGGSGWAHSSSSRFLSRSVSMACQKPRCENARKLSVCASRLSGSASHEM